MVLSLLQAVAGLATLAFSTAAPEQVHVAIADESSFAVSFFTADLCSQPLVQYALDGEILSAEVSSFQYLEDAGYHHHAKITGLKPGLSYTYRVGDLLQEEGGCGSSAEYTLRTPHDSTQRSLDFMVFGDLGSRNHGNGDSTMDYIKTVQDDIELIWHAGDISYADDSFLHLDCVFQFCYEKIWNDFMNEMAEVGMTTLPWMVTPGNHEADCHDPACLTSRTYRNSLSNFTAYNTRFRMPSEETQGTRNMHYSFNAGPVHFLSLDLETGFSGAAEEKRYVLPCGGFGDQVAWIEADLATANASRAERPWIFVAGHHPMYVDGTRNTAMADAIEELLYEYNVDVMFTGHVHSYERDYPVYQGVTESTSYTNIRSPVHILVGGAGNDEMRDDQRRRLNEEKFGVKDPSPAHENDDRAYTRVKDGESWVAVQDKGYFGVGMVHIHNDTHMHFEYVRTTAQEVHDEVWIIKDHA